MGVSLSRAKINHFIKGDTVGSRVLRLPHRRSVTSEPMLDWRCLLNTSATAVLGGMALACAAWTSIATAATEPERHAAIQSGLRHLYESRQAAGHWNSSADTGAAVFALLSQQDKWDDNAALYQALLEKAISYLLNNAAVTTVSTRNDNVNICPGGQDRCTGIYWEDTGRPGYTTGLVAQALALYGARVGADAVATTTGPLADLTWGQIAQGITNALAAGQNTSETGDKSRGWRYVFSPAAQAEISSTPWAVVSLLYNESLGARTPQSLKDNLKASLEKTASGGCSQPNAEPCNPGETGGWLLAMKFAGDDMAHPRPQSALTFLNSYWKTTATTTAHGNFGRPEAMWIIYQALERTIGLNDTSYINNFLTDCGAIPNDRDRNPTADAPCTWSEDYSHWLVKSQKADGSWGDRSDSSDAIRTSFYVSILGAARPPTARYRCSASSEAWKQTPGAWPLPSLILGDQTYTKQELLAILSTPLETASSDAGMIMAKELIAAKFNLARGGDPEAASRMIADADRLLSGFNRKLPTHVPPLTPSGQKMIETAKALNVYNTLLTPGCINSKHLVSGGAPERGRTDTTAQSAAAPATVQIDSAIAPAAAAEKPALAAIPARIRPYIRKGVTALAVSIDGSSLASASADNRVRLWSATTGQQRAVLQGSMGLPTALAFGSNVLASVGRDSVARLWDPVSGRELATLSGHEHAIRSLALSRDGRFLATAGEESRIMLWDLASRKLTRIFFGHTDFVNTLAFSPDGRLLASGGEDARARIFDVATGRSLYTLGGHLGPIDAVAFSPDGTVLASGGQDAVVYLWNPATGRQRQILKGHGAPIQAITFSPDGRLIASGAEDTLIILWNAASGTMDKVLFGSTGMINVLGFDPRGVFLASGTADGNLTLWNVPAGAKMRVISVP
jgi:WD40 repeat protein